MAKPFKWTYQGKALKGWHKWWANSGRSLLDSS
jgi:hypothetical protein